jgi:hypothetical protein
VDKKIIGGTPTLLAKVDPRYKVFRPGEKEAGGAGGLT